MSYEGKSEKKFRIFDKNLSFVFLTKICQNKSICQNKECPTSLSSLLNFQSIGVLTLQFLIFCHFSKKSDARNEKIGQKINFPKNDEDR